MRARGPLFLALALAAFVPLLTASPYMLDSVTGALLLLAYILSWEVHAVPLGEANFGQSLFIGGGAYLTAVLATRTGLGPVASSSITMVACTGVALGLGAVSRNARGAFFSLVTMACGLMLQQSAYLFPGVFGGEEGILGVPVIAASSSGRFYVAWCAVAVVAVTVALVEGSRLGLLLRAAGSDEPLARASGVPVGSVRVLALGLSGALGALAGIAYAHTQGQVNTELLASTLSIRIALLGLLASGRWTVVVVIATFFLRESLAGWSRFEGVLFAALLLAAATWLPGWIGGRRTGRPA